MERLVSVIHEGDKPYKCDSCHNCFGYKGALNRHINAVMRKRSLTNVSFVINIFFFSNQTCLFILQWFMKARNHLDVIFVTQTASRGGINGHIRSIHEG